MQPSIQPMIKKGIIINFYNGSVVVSRSSPPCIYFNIFIFEQFRFHQSCYYFKITPRRIEWILIICLSHLESVSSSWLESRKLVGSFRLSFCYKDQRCTVFPVRLIDIELIKLSVIVHHRVQCQFGVVHWSIVSLAYLDVCTRILETVILGWYPRNLDIIVRNLENFIRGEFRSGHPGQSRPEFSIGQHTQESQQEWHVETKLNYLVFHFEINKIILITQFFQL